MASVNWIEIQLESLLSNAHYSSLFHYLNQYGYLNEYGTKPSTPSSVSRQTAKAIFDNKMLLDPIEVGELVGPTELYRAHDGGSTSKRSAGTLGRCWMQRELVENLWVSTEGGADRKSQFWELVRSCNLVLKEWNAMKHMVCMKVPDGCRVVVVAGEGNWRAMFPKTGNKFDKGLTLQLSKMATEPTVQYVVPVFNPMWVKPVADNRTTWPLLT